MANEKDGKEENGGMKKVAAFIVDKRNLFFLLYVVALVFSLFSRNWVEVENDITTYLPDDTETRQGLTVMNDNFVTYGSARVMMRKHHSCQCPGPGRPDRGHRRRFPGDL